MQVITLPLIGTVAAWRAEARRLAQHQVLTRQLNSIETLGQTTVLCVDKTGTLTHNRMRVAALQVADGFRLGRIRRCPRPTTSCSNTRCWPATGAPPLPAQAVLEQQAIVASLPHTEQRLRQENLHLLLTGERAHLRIENISPWVSWMNQRL